MNNAEIGKGYIIHQTFVNGNPVEEEREDFLMKNGIMKTRKIRKTFRNPLEKRVRFQSPMNKPHIFSVNPERMPISVYKQPVDSILINRIRMQKQKKVAKKKSKRTRISVKKGNKRQSARKNKR